MGLVEQLKKAFEKRRLNKSGLGKMRFEVERVIRWH